MKIINLIDPKGRTSLMYSIKSEEKNNIQTTKLERLEEKSQDLGDKIRRSFYLNTKNDKEIVVISLMKEQVFVNIAAVSQDLFKLASVSTKINFVDTKASEIIEIYYTPTTERKIFVIDIDTGDEIEPEFNLTSSGEMRGIINLEVGKKYLTIELRDAAYRSILAGACQLILEDGVLKLNISKDEAKRVRIDKYMELIKSGKSIEQKLMDTSIEKER